MILTNNCESGLRINYIFCIYCIANRTGFESPKLYCV